MTDQKNQKNSLILSAFIAILIVVMSIFSASAVTVSISGLSGTTITKGNSQVFTITVTMENLDRFVPVSNLTLNISGPTAKQWTFNPVTGAIIDPPGDTNISVNPTSPPNPNHYGNGSGYGVDNGIGYDFGYGYGYGYNYGQGNGNVSFTYQVTLFTNNLTEGSYTAIAYLNTGNSTKPNFASTSASFTVTAASTSTPPSSGGGSSGGGGGGGGGGGTSGENYSNIEAKEKYDLHIFKDKTTAYRFTNGANPIIYVNITGNTSAGEVTTSVELLRNTSSLVKIRAPGLVYKNMNIWVGTSGFAVAKNIKTSIIGFRVDNSWMQNNNLAASSIRMVKWNGIEWVQLETTLIAKDSTYTYYEAKTDRFSPFAITGMIGEEAPKETPAVGASEIPAVSKPSEPAGTVSPVKKSGGFKDILTASAVLLAIIAAVLASMYISKRKRR